MSTTHFKYDVYFLMNSKTGKSGDKPRFMRQYPSVNLYSDHITFGGDLWIVWFGTTHFCCSGYSINFKLMTNSLEVYTKFIKLMVWKWNIFIIIIIIINNHNYNFPFWFLFLSISLVQNGFFCSQLNFPPPPRLPLPPSEFFVQYKMKCW